MSRSTPPIEGGMVLIAMIGDGKTRGQAAIRDIDNQH
jgi:hypothetical protein